MAQISTIALNPTRDIPKSDFDKQGKSITTRFSPTELTANVTSGDNLLIATLPKYARIIEAGVRFLGTSGLSLSFVTLQSNENSTVTLLTNPLSSTTAGSVPMRVAPPSVDLTYVKTLELLVGGNSIDNTATGIIECYVHYDQFKEAG